MSEHGSHGHHSHHHHHHEHESAYRQRQKKKRNAVIGVCAVLAAFALVVGGFAVLERIRDQEEAKSIEASKSVASAEEEDVSSDLEEADLAGAAALAAGGDYLTDDNTVDLDDGLYAFDHRIETFLFIGTDGSGNESGEGKDYQGAMADFLVLMVADHTDDSYGFIQIDRNTVTEINMIDTDGHLIDIRDMQICTSHCYGGNPEESALNTVEAVKYLLGELETIDGYYVLNMTDVGTLSDVVGGVEVTLEDDLTSISPEFKKGATVLLTGEKAEMFVRARKNVGDEDNASRMRRQRTFMDAFRTKVMSRVRNDKNFISTIYKALKNSALTDLSGNDISRIAEMFRKGENKGIFKFEGESKIEVILEDGIEHETFYPSEQSIRDVMTELFSLELLESYDEEEEDSAEDEEEEDEDAEVWSDDEEVWSDDEEVWSDDEEVRPDDEEDEEIQSDEEEVRSEDEEKEISRYESTEQPVES